MLILGVVGLIKPLEVQKNTVWKEIPFSLLAVVVLFVMVNDSFISGLDKDVLTRGDGIILLSFLIIFLVYTFFISKVESSDEPEVKAHKIPKSLLFIGLGFVGLFVGGKLVVDNAVSIARFFSVSDKLIALTIVSAGTSLPELITSIVAVRKGNIDLAVGNVVGSNIFNIFSILGISSVINPVEYNSILNIDIYILTVASILLFVFMFTGKVCKLDRWEAVIFLTGYLVYTAYILIRK
jgi:cation:H+ antiporter